MRRQIKTKRRNMIISKEEKNAFHIRLRNLRMSLKSVH